MAEILLGQSYFLRFDPKLWQAMQPYPPLGTLYAASFLRQKGFDVALFDAMLASSTEEWADRLRAERPAFAVLYEDSFNYLSKMCLLRMREAAFEMIGQGRCAGVTVIVSSSDATDHLEEYFARGADYILIGEAEQSLAALLASLTGRSALPADQIAGVAAPGARTGTVAAARPERDLDKLPFPAWDLADLDRYRDIWRSRHGFFSLNMVTTRGCPYSCNWCAKPIYGQRYDSRSPENVVEELAWLKQSAAPDHIWFADDIFGLKKGWIGRFSELVCQQGLQTPFKCLLRSDLVTEPRAEQLRRAGCQTVWIGAESGSQKILESMEKGTTVEDNLRATRQLQRAGIQVGHFLQFGYPGEGWPEIRETVRMLRRSRPDDIGISVSYPLPGTKFYQRVKPQLGPRRNWRDGNDLAMLYQGHYPTRFYRRLHRAIHTEHRARKGWQQLSAGDWKGLKPVLRAWRLPWDWMLLRAMRLARREGGRRREDGERKRGWQPGSQTASASGSENSVSGSDSSRPAPDAFPVSLPVPRLPVSPSLSGRHTMLSLSRRDRARLRQNQHTHRIGSLPVLVLMPHSSCNCACVMCDIWKSNRQKAEISLEQLRPHLDAFRRLGVRTVALSGGEAMLHTNLWAFCRLLSQLDIYIQLLSTGLLLARHAPEVVRHCHETIVSLDGSPPVHDAIRRVPRAFERLAEGVAALKAAQPGHRVTARCVLQRRNCFDLTGIIQAAKRLGVDQLSFLPVDVSSEAFNRPGGWDEPQADSVALSASQANDFPQRLEEALDRHAEDFQGGFIAESPAKMKRIADHFQARAKGRLPQAPQCNAPWVSSVIEADGTVRPCFFHPPLGNIHEDPLESILNSPQAVRFRRRLQVGTDPVCRRCVCSLHLETRGPLSRAAQRLFNHA